MIKSVMLDQSSSSHRGSLAGSLQPLEKTGRKAEFISGRALMKLWKNTLLRMRTKRWIPASILALLMMIIFLHSSGLFSSKPRMNPRDKRAGGVSSNFRSSREVHENSLMSVKEYAEERLQFLIPKYEEDRCSKRMQRSAASKHLREWLANDLALNIAMLSKREFLSILLRVTNRQGAVVEVGPARGDQLTVPAALLGRDVYAVEPDKRSYDALTNQTKSMSNVKIVEAAAGNFTGEGNLRIHESRPDYSCFTCLDLHRAEVSEKKVKVTQLDRIVSAPTAILKTATRGSEYEILQGATKLFDFVGVRYAIVEIDPTLSTREKSRLILGFLFSRGYECFDLMWRTPNAHSYGTRLKEEEAPDFVEALIKENTYTDLVCFKC